MNKYKIIVVTVFVFLLCTAYKVRGFLDEAPLLGKIIYIDAGHGGPDPGALYKDIYEKTINLEITKRLQDALMAKGAIVYMTRTDDYDLASPGAYLRKRSDLSKRAYLINNSDCELYLSVHLNASPSTNWRGAQVFYDDKNSENKVIADIMQKEFKSKLSSKRKYKEIKSLYMYKQITKPGVLLEVGFISNANERYILQKSYYQNRIVSAIVNGVITYLK